MQSGRYAHPPCCSILLTARAVDGSTGRSRGYAFITMDSLDEANAAIAAINNMDIDGRQVRFLSFPVLCPNPAAAGEGGGLAAQAPP